MFMKISTTKTPTLIEESPSAESPESFRQGILSRIHTKRSDLKGLGSQKKVSFEDEEFEEPRRRRTREELRELWKTAINQQILLIQMEKENKKLKDTQSVVCYKRMKLDYQEVTACTSEAVVAWDTVFRQRLRHVQSPQDALGAAIQLGVPRHKRGEIWMLLMDKQRNQGLPPENCVKDIGIDVSADYRELLNQLTAQQHAILVDLGA